MVTNPLSARARGIIYVTAIVIGAVSLVATAILNVINLEQWGVSMLRLSLARDEARIAAALAAAATTDTPVHMRDLDHD